MCQASKYISKPTVRKIKHTTASKTADQHRPSLNRNLMHSPDMAAFRIMTPVIQRMPDPSSAIITQYVQSKGLGNLPDNLIKIFFTILQSHENNFSVLDSILNKILIEKANLEAEEFNTYLTNLRKLLSVMGNQQLVIDPNPYRDKTGNIVISNKNHIIEGRSFAERLNPEQLNLFNQKRNILCKYCLESDIQGVIAGAAINVKMERTLLQYQFDPIVDAAALKAFVNRFALMTDYIKKTGDRKLNAETKICDKYYIKSTGSDPHQGGQHALFLISKRNPMEEIVYKPHSLQFEDAFLGQEGLLASIMSIKTFTRFKKQLPSININPNSHMESFLIRVGHINQPLQEKQVRQQFYRLGLLEALMKMSGITDLHCENIIFTKDGPVALDAECGADFSGTLIEGMCAPGTVREDRPPHLSGMLNPSALYVKVHAKVPVFAERDHYNEFYLEGRLSMEKKLFENRVDVLNTLEQKLQKAESCRIAPINTQRLATLFDIYIFYSSEYFQKAADEIQILTGQYRHQPQTIEEMALSCNDAASAVQRIKTGLMPLLTGVYFLPRKLLMDDISQAERKLEIIGDQIPKIYHVGEKNDDDDDTEEELAWALHNTVMIINDVLSTLSASLDVYSIADWEYDSVVAHFNSPNMAFAGGRNTRAEIDRSQFRTCFIQAFQQGTLPAFTLQLKAADHIHAGAILLDGHQIGQVRTDDDQHDMEEWELRSRYVDHARDILYSYGIYAFEQALIQVLGFTPETAKPVATEVFHGIADIRNDQLKLEYLSTVLKEKLHLTPEEKCKEAAKNILSVENLKEFLS